MVSQVNSIPKFATVSIFLLVLLISYVFCSPWEHLPKDCGKTRYSNTNQSNRIVNGYAAKLGQFPWTVRLGETIQNHIIFFCGGSLINRYFVISAAHCGEFGDVIRIGESDETTDIDCDSSGVCAPPHQDIKPKRYIMENFCRQLATNDIMLIELEKPAQLNDFVQPVCLFQKPYHLEKLVGSTVVVAGWGQTLGTDQRSASTKLMYGSMQVLDYKRCKKIFVTIVPDIVFCLSDDLSGYNQRSCFGDSGGPALYTSNVDGVERSYLIGVVSFGLAFCIGASVYTNVSHYLGTFLTHIDKS